VQINLERVADRLPSWAQGRSGHRIAAAVAVVLLVVVVAVSCGGGASGRADVPVLSDGPDAGLAGVRSPSDERGGTLRAVASEIDSLDPQRSYLPGAWNLMRLYARTLVTYSSEPGKTDQLVPDLATDLGTTDDGGKTWTFTLKDGVRFENGEPITSQDVKYGISRSFAVDIIVGGPNYVIDLLDNPGIDDYPGPYSGDEDAPPLATIKTPDARTIVFTLHSPQRDFPYVLALPSSSPVPASLDTGGRYEDDPVSSGPYAITAVDQQVGIVLDRNPEWDPATDEVRTALPDRVLVRTDMSGIERDQALLAGSADVDISGTGVQAPTVARLQADDEQGEQLRGRVDDLRSGAVRLLALPTDVEPMNNPACRAAVAAAVDRKALQDALGGPVNAVRTSVLWPRDVPGGPEDLDPGSDPRAAQAALEECGRPEGFSTTLAVADVPSNVEAAKGVAAQLAEVGIQVEIAAFEPGEFYAETVGRPASVKENGFGIVLATWMADFPTVGSFLTPLVDGGSIQEIGNTNYARLDLKAVNALVDQAEAAPDEAAATELWRQVAAQVDALDVYVPFAENRIQLLAGQRLHNGVVMRPYGGYDLATAGVL
jgi:peptide/nickel transport system substrate-binding protein